MKTIKVLRCFLSIILIGGIGLLSIPSIAYSVDGVDLVPIEFTNDNLIAMFRNGDVTVEYSLSSTTSMDINLYDMSAGTKTLQTLTTTPITFTLDELQTNSTHTWVNFSSDFAYSQRAVNGNVIQNVTFSLPFEYYLDNSIFKANFFYSGLSNGNQTTCNFIVMKYFDGGIASILDNDLVNGSRLTHYWSSMTTTNMWARQYNFVPEGYTLDNTVGSGIRTAYSTFTGYLTTTDSTSVIGAIFDVNTARAQGSGTGYDYFFCAPIMLSVDFTTTVYVMPDIADTVEEYLEIIAGPTTPEQQARINELKDKFDDTLDDLDGAKENIHKDMPDLPSVSDLPEEAIEGMEDASEYVINPFLSIGIVSTLLGVTFIFTVIKILLYGSGPY